MFWTRKKDKVATLDLSKVPDQAFQKPTRSLSSSDLDALKAQSEMVTPAGNSEQPQTENAGISVVTVPTIVTANSNKTSSDTESDFEQLNKSSSDSSSNVPSPTPQPVFSPSLPSQSGQPGQSLPRSEPPSLNPVSKRLVASIVQNAPVEHTFTEEQKKALMKDVRENPRSTIHLFPEDIKQANHQTFDEDPTNFPINQHPVSNERRQAAKNNQGSPPLPDKPANLRAPKIGSSDGSNPFYGDNKLYVVIGLVAIVGGIGALYYYVSGKKEAMEEQAAA